MEDSSSSENHSPLRYAFTVAAAAVVGYTLFRFLKSGSRSGDQHDRYEPSSEHSSRPSAKHTEHQPISSVRKANISRPKKTSFPKKKVQWIPGLRVREQKILNLMPSGKPTQMSEVAKHFKNVTDRTLRRDFKRLIKKGRIRRTGTTRSTTYVKV